MVDHPKLTQAPINEVVVGFVFEPVVGLTPVLHGLYWDRRRADFPAHEVHPAITDVPTIWEGAAPQRTWLISKNETQLVQIQNDRFFVNWRKRGADDAYPRFTTRDGVPGLLDYALGEYDRFAAFCAEHGIELRLAAVELTKIDLLLQGQHWSDLKDLGSLLPMTRPLAELSDGPSAEVALKFAETGEDTLTFVTVGSGMERQTQTRVIRLETRTRQNRVERTKLEATFKGLNDRVNSLFFRFVPREQLYRFGGTA